MSFMRRQTVIGIISDTHGSLPNAVLDVFSGRQDGVQVLEECYVDGTGEDVPAPRVVDCIVHAGDIGELAPISQGVLDALQAIAPVHVVRGNRDVAGYVAGGEPVSEQLCAFESCGIEIAVMHKPEDLRAALECASTKPRVQIHGHTHVPKVRRIGNRLLLCPGAISRPKGDWPCRSVALLYLEEPGKLIGAQILKV